MFLLQETANIFSKKCVGVSGKLVATYFIQGYFCHFCSLQFCIIFVLANKKIGYHTLGISLNSEWGKKVTRVI